MNLLVILVPAHLYITVYSLKRPTGQRAVLLERRIRIQEGKNDQHSDKKRRKWRNFMFWSAGCSLLREYFFFAVIFLSLTLDPDWIRIPIGIHPKMLDPDPYQMNTDPKPCLCVIMLLSFLPYQMDTGQWTRNQISSESRPFHSVSKIKKNTVWQKNRNDRFLIFIVELLLWVPVPVPYPTGVIFPFLYFVKNECC
jgi:hypothetical protein